MYDHAYFINWKYKFQRQLRYLLRAWKHLKDLKDQISIAIEKKRPLFLLVLLSYKRKGVATSDSIVFTCFVISHPYPW